MPDINFVLPHILYWPSVVLIPLLVVYFVFKTKNKPTETKYNSSIAYFFWLTGGIMGLHRLYLKSFIGLFYLSLFLFILISNQEASTARIIESTQRNALLKTEFLYNRAIKKDQTDKLPALRAEIETIKIQKAFGAEERRKWNRNSEYSFYVLLLLMAIDFVLIPRMVSRRNKKITDLHMSDDDSACIATEEDRGIDDVYSEKLHPPNFSSPILNKFVTFVDTTNHYVGQYIAVWTLIAVFVFYYEVMVRYVFNSPTNWAHESMFLVFGMQYLYAGGYALKEGAHVRVDVLYTRMSELNKARIDTLTSVFFFIFTMSLMYTGYIFFDDAFQFQEVSFTEWAVSYWPTKFSIFGGAILLFMQGFANLLRDLQKVTAANKQLEEV